MAADDGSPACGRPCGWRRDDRQGRRGDRHSAATAAAAGGGGGGGGHELAAIRPSAAVASAAAAAATTAVAVQVPSPPACDEGLGRSHVCAAGVRVRVLHLPRGSSSRWNRETPCLLLPRASGASPRGPSWCTLPGGTRSSAPRRPGPRAPSPEPLRARAPCGVPLPRGGHRARPGRRNRRRR